MQYIIGIVSCYNKNMEKQKLAIKINKPVKDVFAFTINPKNTPKWIDAIVIEETNEWPPQIGTIYRNQDKTGQWREIKMTTFEPDKMFVMSEENGFHIRYTFTPLNINTTELECYLWMDSGELKDTLTMEILEKLKQIIEAES